MTLYTALDQEKRSSGSLWHEHTHTNEHRQSHSAQIGRIGTALAWVTSGYFTMFFLFYDPEKKSLGFAFLSGVRDTLPK